MVQLFSYRSVSIKTWHLDADNLERSVALREASAEADMLRGISPASLGSRKETFDD